MGFCESKNKSETSEKGKIKGNGKGIAVIHTLIQPIIHQDIQPIITKNITPIIKKIIIPVIVRNEMEAQNIPRELILNHPDVRRAMGEMEPPPNEMLNNENEQPIGPSPNSEKIPEDRPQDINQKPKLNFECEPTLVKVVGEVHHYIQVKEKHATQKIIMPLIQDEIKVLVRPQIEPIIFP